MAKGKLKAPIPTAVPPMGQPTGSQPSERGNGMRRETQSAFRSGAPSMAGMTPPNPSDPAAAPTITVPEQLVGLELGRTGLIQFYGRLADEILPELSYERGRRVYREMSDNDPTIGALLMAIGLMIRSVTFRVEADEQDDPRAQFIDECLVDMDHTWEDLTAEITRGTLVWGWSFHETVYKRRQQGDSQFADGKIGWKKLPVRSQESLWRWVYDTDQTTLLGMVQRPAPDYRERYIPLEKGLLFRFEALKDSPEGRSILRNAYRPWFYKKYIEQLEAIGIERDLAGLPVMYAPAALFGGNPPAGSSGVLDMLQKIVVNIRLDEQMGVVMPQAYDDKNNPLYKLELLAAAGGKQHDTSEVINRYDTRILMTVLADFIMLGQSAGGHGSFALAKSKTDLFNVALGAWLDAIAGTFNRHAIPRLLELNGMPTDNPPQLVHGDVERKDIADLADALQKLSMAGMPIFPNPKLEAALLEFMKLPVPTPEEQALREDQAGAEMELQQAQTQQQLQAAKQPPQPPVPAVKPTEQEPPRAG